MEHREPSRKRIRKDDELRVRMLQDERLLLDRVAEHKGVPVSEWVRAVLRRAALRALAGTDDA